MGSRPWVLGRRLRVIGNGFVVNRTRPRVKTWTNRLIEDEAGIADVLRGTRAIAVLGIKTIARAEQPAYYVPEYMQNAGYRILPVPVYHPEAREILGEPVYRRVADVPPPVDMVNVFRRSRDIPPHVDDIIAAKPDSVWFQLGIRNESAAEALARAGIRVVQDRCLMVEHRRHIR